MGDCTDPLNYLEQCRDYLALNPLTDVELLTTLRNVLFGTAWDWWDVVRLSEEYMDELEERIRTQVQCIESICDVLLQTCQRRK